MGHLAPDLLDSWRLRPWLWPSPPRPDGLRPGPPRWDGRGTQLLRGRPSLPRSCSSPPPMALLATLTGVLIGEVVIRRRDWLKVCFNLGTYAASTAAMIVTYHVLAGGTPAVRAYVRPLPRLRLRFAFTAVNLALALLLKVTVAASPEPCCRRSGACRRSWPWARSASVDGCGLCHRRLARRSCPSAFLPALALWYAYRAAAQHAEAVERNRWLVTSGRAARPARPGQQHPRGVSRGHPPDRRRSRDA